MIRLDFDAHQLAGVAVELDAMRPEVDRALKSTVSRMGGWLRAQARKSLKESTALKAGLLRNRLKSLRIVKRKDGSFGGIWIGLNPIDLKLLDARQDDKGVSAGPKGGDRQEFKGAFLGPKPGSVAEKLRGGAFKRRSKARLGIERQGYAIRDKAEQALESDLFDGFQARFMVVFERELKWRISTRAQA